MNERIKEFAKQAGFKVNFQHEDHQTIRMAQYTEFAEMIVRECVQKLNIEIDRLCEYKNSLPEYSNQSKREDIDLVVEKCHDNIQMIKQHFGVE